MRIDILKTNLQAEGFTHLFNKNPAVMRHVAIICQCFENRNDIADGNLFAQKPLKDALDVSVSVFVCIEDFIDDDGVGFLDFVDDCLGFKTAEDFSRMRADDLSDVGCDNRRRINDGITGSLRISTLLFAYPDGRNSESRVHGCLTLDFLGNGTSVHAHVVAELDFASASLDSLDFETVFIRVKGHIVDDSDFRNDETQVKACLTADSCNSLKKLRAFFLVYERNEGVSKFQSEGIQRNDRADFLAGSTSLFALGFLLFLKFFGERSLLFSDKVVSCENEETADRKKKIPREVGDKAHKSKCNSSDNIDITARCKLFLELVAKDFLA